jgi:hypothetical protein
VHRQEPDWGCRGSGLEIAACPLFLLLVRAAGSSCAVGARLGCRGSGPERAAGPAGGVGSYCGKVMLADRSQERNCRV